MNNRFCKSSCYLAACTSLFFFTLNCIASDNAAPPKIGNFALPGSQAPGPLISFGQHIIDKNETQLSLFLDDYNGVGEHFVDLVPSVLYGVTDNFSFILNVPYAASYESAQQQSSGFEDESAQAEYAFYNKSTSRFADQAIVVGGMTFPTGSIQKNPSTGIGSYSFFLGTTFNRTYVDWFVFASPGVVLTTEDNNTQFGNSFLYQGGFGRNIANTNKWLFAWITEIDGTYTEKNKMYGVIDSDSGGNVIYVTPSLWASTKTFIFQLGAGFPVIQHFNGNQSRDTYLLAANLSWSIY